MRLPRRRPVRRGARWPGDAGALRGSWTRRFRAWSLPLDSNDEVVEPLESVHLALNHLFGHGRAPRALLLQRRQAGRWRTIARWTPPQRHWCVRLPAATAGRDLRLLGVGPRPAQRLPALALRRAARHRLAALLLDLGTGTPRTPSWQHVQELDRMRLVGPGAAREPLAGLAVEWYGRFGNNVLQILRAAALAERLGLGEITLPPHGQLRPTTQPGSPAFVAAATAAPRLRLKGRFYFPELMPDLASRLTAAGLRDLAQRHARPLLDPTLWSAPAAEDELVIHLRGGDIFRSERPPHPDYVQPPLAFHRRCVEDALARGFTRFRLVSEDRRNPCVDALAAWLDARGLPCVVQCDSFERDLATLLGARALVASNSSLLGVVALLSDRLRLFYSFDAAGQVLPSLPPSAVFAWGVTAISQADQAGGYIKAGQWENSAAQRALMLSYPESALGPPVLSPGKAGGEA